MVERSCSAVDPLTGQPDKARRHSMTQAADSTAPALVSQRFVDAFNARDEQALRKLYHPDARI